MCGDSRVVLTLALVVGSFAGPLTGQFGILEKVLSSVQSVNFYYLYGGFEPRSTVLTTSDPGQPPNQTGLKGFGFEVSISAGASEGPVIDSAACVLKRSRSALDTVEIVTDFAGADVSQPVATHVKTKPHAKDPCRHRVTASYELAVGYSQMRGFRAQDSTYQLYGSLRELPSAAFYAVFYPDNPFNIYVGFRAGLVDLHSLRAYDTSNVVYAGAATTFQAGVAVGGVAEVGPLVVFVEPSFNIRNFPSIEWGAVANQVPRRFPRELQMSGWQFAIGFQVDVTPQKAEDSSPK